MYKTYQKSEGERVTPNKLVQILEDNTIADLPKIKKGITLKSPITNNYLKGDNSLNKIDGNKIITVVENMLYVSKYENYDFIQINEIELEKKDSVHNKPKVISLNENKSVIVYGNGSIIGCYFIHIDEANNINEISKKFIITSNVAGIQFDAVALSENKIVITYLERVDKTDNKILAIKTPVYAIVNISKNNKMSMTQEPKQIDINNEKISVELTLVTKLSEDEFIGTYVLKDSVHNRSSVFSTVFKIDSKNIINQFETLNYQGYYSDFHAKTIKPFYLDDYKIITFEFLDNFNFNMVLREIEQNLNTGVYTFNTLCTVKPKSSYPFKIHNIDLLRNNHDDSRDFILFNRQIININSTNDSISLLDEVPEFKTASISPYKLNILPTINLENNLMLALNEDNDFQMVKHDKYKGGFLGIAKSRCNHE